MIKSQGKLAQNNPFQFFKKEFGNESENLSEDQEIVIEGRILASILKAYLSEQIQDNLLNSNLLKDFYSLFSDLSKTVKKLEKHMKNYFAEQRTAIINEVLDHINKSSFEMLTVQNLKVKSSPGKSGILLNEDGIYIKFLMA